MSDEAVPIGQYPSARDRLERCRSLLGDATTCDESFIELLRVTLPREIVDTDHPKEQTSKLVALFEYSGKLATCATLEDVCPGQRFAYYRRGSLDDSGKSSEVLDMLVLCPLELDSCKTLSVDIQNLRKK